MTEPPDAIAVNRMLKSEITRVLDKYLIRARNGDIAASALTVELLPFFEDAAKHLMAARAVKQRAEKVLAELISDKPAGEIIGNSIDMLKEILKKQES